MLADLGRLGGQHHRRRFVDEHDLWDRAIEIVGQAMGDRHREQFRPPSAIGVGVGLSARRPARTGRRRPEDIDVIELHDCFSVNEIITYEAGARPDEGEGHLLCRQSRHHHGGRWVVNPSAELISQGHPSVRPGSPSATSSPPAASRASADARQVDGARYALQQHNLAWRHRGRHHLREARPLTEKQDGKTYDRHQV